MSTEETPEIATENASETPPGAVGPDLIRAEVRRLPNAPGVYRMLAANGDVLYVGKARDLKKRVAAYAKGVGHTNRIARMVQETASLIVVTTASETEALLLEANLIKRLKPRFNVSYRDDKSFPNILVRTDHAFPQILKHRGARATPGQYFGPFASAGAVNRTLNTLQPRVSAPVLLRLRFREPYAALPSLSNQALQRALRRTHSARRLRLTRDRSHRVSPRPNRDGESQSIAGNGRSLRAP
jgi:predicted GIY-YIG superfamily endonuclease